MTPELRKALEEEATAQEALRDELEKKGVETDPGPKDRTDAWWDNYHSYIAARVKAERIRMMLSAYANPADGKQE